MENPAHHVIFILCGLGLGLVSTLTFVTHVNHIRQRDRFDVVPVPQEILDRENTLAAKQLSLLHEAESHNSAKKERQRDYMCKGPHCSREECCEPRGQCHTVSCGFGAQLSTNPSACAHATCTQSECCSYSVLTVFCAVCMKLAALVQIEPLGVWVFVEHSWSALIGSIEACLLFIKSASPLAVAQSWAGTWRPLFELFWNSLRIVHFMKFYYGLTSIGHQHAIIALLCGMVSTFLGDNATWLMFAAVVWLWTPSCVQVFSDALQSVVQSRNFLVFLWHHSQLRSACIQIFMFVTRMDAITHFRYLTTHDISCFVSSLAITVLTLWLEQSKPKYPEDLCAVFAGLCPVSKDEKPTGGAVLNLFRRAASSAQSMLSNAVGKVAKEVVDTICVDFLGFYLGIVIQGGEGRLHLYLGCRGTWKHLYTSEAQPPNEDRIFVNVMLFVGGLGCVFLLHLVSGVVVNAVHISVGALAW